MERWYSYLAVEGNIGSGKTTLAQMLGNRLNGNLILEEFEDNPFLPRFYSDPERYSFSLELSFLADRYHQLNRLLHNRSLFEPITVSDYFLSKSLIFAQTTLEGEELELFHNLYHIMYSNLPKPDVLIYLYAPVEKLRERIALRGREYEQAIDPNYLEQLQKRYFDFFRQHPELRVVVIDTSDVDIRDNKLWVERLLESIETTVPKGLHHVDIKVK